MSTYTQIEFKPDLYILEESVIAELATSKYLNEDLKPTSPSERTWTTYNVAMLWVGMIIAITGFSFSASLVALGLSPVAAIANVAIGNLIVLIPMQINSHAGTKYGIPFPVYSRLAFGQTGAHIPSMARSIVAAGWCAVQSWVAGAAISAIVGVFISSWDTEGTGRFVGFGIFILIVLYLTLKGSEGIKWVEAIGSPILIFVVVGLIVWTAMKGLEFDYTFGTMLAQPGNDTLVTENGGWWIVFMSGITSNIAVWATLALNIPDLSRYAKGQREQFRGQVFALPLSATALAVVGAFFAEVTRVAYGTAQHDPTVVMQYIDNKVVVVIVALATIVATLTTNIAANVVAPANGFSNLSPRRISYRTGVIITCVLTIVYRPWWMFGSAGAWMFGFLGTVGMLLGPVAAILVADYVIVKKRRIDVKDLYTENEGRYTYNKGWNVRAILAWLIAIFLPSLHTIFGMDGTVLVWISANSYVFGFLVGLVAYVLLMKSEKKSYISQEEFDTISQRLAE